MVGFKELLCRLQIQEQMTKQHQTRVDVSVFSGAKEEPGGRAEGSERDLDPSNETPD